MGLATKPRLITPREDSPFADHQLYPADGHYKECWWNGCRECKKHREDCPCNRCDSRHSFRELLAHEARDRGRIQERDERERQRQELERQEQDQRRRKLAHEDRRMARERKRWDTLDLAGLKANVELEGGLDAFAESFDFDAETDRLPAVLERSDGETVLYAAKTNVLHGTPGSGKSWIAMIAILGAVTGQKAMRGLVVGCATAIDATIRNLVEVGMLKKTRVGRSDNSLSYRQRGRCWSRTTSPS